MAGARNPTDERAGVIEILSAGFCEVMKNHVPLPGTADVISVGAYVDLSHVLDEAQPGPPPERSR